MAAEASQNPIDPDLTAIVTMYKNPKMIADDVFVRLPPKSKREQRVTSIPLGTFFTLPELEVGPKSEPNRIDATYERTLIDVRDYGLDDVIPIDDELQSAAQASAGGYQHNPTGFAAELLSSLLALGREVRCAALVFDPTKHSVVETLVGANRFEDPSSKPVDVIMDLLETPLMRPNSLVMGQKVWSILRRHPQILKSLGSFTGDGVASRERVARDIFEVESILVGQGRVNVARPGQPPQITRIWGNHVAGILTDPLAAKAGGITFGVTAQYARNGNVQVAWKDFDKKIGIPGAYTVRVGESIYEHVVAPGVGALIRDAVS